MSPPRSPRDPTYTPSGLNPLCSHPRIFSNRNCHRSISPLKVHLSHHQMNKKHAQPPSPLPVDPFSKHPPTPQSPSPSTPHVSPLSPPRPRPDMHLQPQSTSRSQSIVAQIRESQQIPGTCHGERCDWLPWWVGIGRILGGLVSRWLAHLCHDGAAVFCLDYTNEGSDECWTVVRQSSAKRKASLERSKRRSSDGDFENS